MKRILRWLGSLKMAVALLLLIAVVLAYGTIYEARFGTAAVQRFVYHAVWFQLLLGFLAVNLAVAALERYPWRRRHLPFVLAHIGIICILVGGIIGGRWGIEGQLIIPEGETAHVLETPGNVLVVRQPNPGVPHIIPTRFETQAWVREPNAVFPLDVDGRAVTLTVDRYYPDAVVDEQFYDDGAAENPAVQVRLADQGHEDTVWFAARDPERFGVGWAQAHVLFMEAASDTQLRQVLGATQPADQPRGVVSVRVPSKHVARQIPVPAQMNQRVRIQGTPYELIFKDYFADFAIADTGLVSRSDEPNNPAVSFTVSGPEGTDAYMLFAFHPDFQLSHGREHQIPIEVTYAHPAGTMLPPNAIALVRAPDGHLLAVMTDDGGKRQVVDPVRVGQSYTHPSLGYALTVDRYYPRARIEQHFVNQGDEIKAEALHVVAREGDQQAHTWLSLRGTAELPLGQKPLIVEYRPGQRPLPVQVKLLDFRKTEYPGTSMAAGFEADVELTDLQRGVTLKRTISMNNPLKYGGYSFFQSSYFMGEVETTVLSVRNDPGTPLVYAGFIIVVLGVVAMFLRRQFA